MDKKREEFLESIKVLSTLKSNFEETAIPKVIGEEKTVEERLEDLRPYLEDDIDL